MSVFSELRSQIPGLEIWTSPNQTEAYSRDEALKGKVSPLAVVFPRSTEEVSAILTWANTKRIPIIPRGAGTGLSGGAVPIQSSVILSLERMNRILEVSPEDSVAVVEPGVITGQIRTAAEEQGLFYPPIPASVDMCSIGGNVATNAGGLCAVKYGVTKDFVVGLEAVLPTGEIIRTGGRYSKCSTGLNLTQLMTGSEGTLAVITKITLRLIPLPKERLTMLVPFSTLEKVGQAIVSIFASRILPPTLELLPKEAVTLVLARHPELNFPYIDACASLLIELDSRDGATLPAEAMILEATVTPFASAQPAVAATAAQRTELWSVRKSVRDSIVAAGEYIEADSVVPRRNLPRLLLAAYESGKEFGTPVISYGHAGDGNLHTYFLRERRDQSDWDQVAPQVLKRFLEKTVELEGTISGEHGIGFLKRDYMPLALSTSELDLMRRLKRAFDPNNILNPGKVLPL